MFPHFTRLANFTCIDWRILSVGNDKLMINGSMIFTGMMNQLQVIYLLMYLKWSKASYLLFWSHLTFICLHLRISWSTGFAIQASEEKLSARVCWPKGFRGTWSTWDVIWNNARTTIKCWPSKEETGIRGCESHKAWKCWWKACTPK